MSIRHWPATERPREKLLKEGPEQLSDAELLAIFLRTGTRGKSAVALARDLLQHYGNLRTLLNATAKDFCQQHGMGPAKYSQLHAAMELGQRYLASNLAIQDVMHDPADCIAYLQHRLSKKTNEVFAALYLNTKHHVIAYEEHFEGSIDNSHVYPRILLQRALANNAAAVIFSHNHPSGDPTPSQSDINLTHQMSKLLAEIDVRVLDHIIVGHKNTLSLKQLGLF